METITENRIFDFIVNDSRYGSEWRGMQRSIEKGYIEHQMRISFEALRKGLDAKIEEIEDRSNKTLQNLNNLFKEDIKKRLTKISCFFGIKVSEKGIIFYTYIDIAINPPSDPKEAVLREKKAFLGMEDRLIKEYSGKFVAILNGEVVEADEDKTNLCLKVWKKYGKVPMYIGKPGEEEKVVHMLSPRI